MQPLPTSHETAAPRIVPERVEQASRHDLPTHREETRVPVLNNSTRFVTTHHRPHFALRYGKRIRRSPAQVIPIEEALAQEQEATGRLHTRRCRNYETSLKDTVVAISTNTFQHPRSPILE